MVKLLGNAVKTGEIQIQLLLKLNYISCLVGRKGAFNSNTTLVKVKYIKYGVQNMTELFKYNSC